MSSSSRGSVPRSLTHLRAAREANDLNQNQNHRRQRQQENPTGLNTNINMNMNMNMITNTNNDGNDNSVIQSNSIQTQFTALSNQKETFVRERNLAQKELQQIQKDHQSIKTEHDRLIESSLQAKERLGQRMEKLTMFKEQEARILQLTENEFRAIHDCTNHSKMLDQKKEEASKKYTAEMGPLNFELAFLLEGRLQKKTERCISLRSVQVVLLPEIGRAAKDQNRPQLLNEKDNLYQSIECLREATAERQEHIALLRELYGAIVLQQDETNTNGGCINGALRNSDTSTSSSRTIAAGDEFEGEHMNLFYGTSNDD